MVNTIEKSWFDMVNIDTLENGLFSMIDTIEKLGLTRLIYWGRLECAPVGLGGNRVKR